jgi:peptidoglycan/LPS O-acetylase OafA/YrhL
MLCGQELWHSEVPSLLSGGGYLRMTTSEEAPVAGSRGKLHLRRIDVLRGVAILMVFLLHWYGHSVGTDHLPWKGLVLDFASAPTLSFYLFYPLSFGWFGVPLFFVISGFCIHASTLNAGQLRIGTFVGRRFWRIYPPYLAALFLAVALTGTNVSSGNGRAQLWSHLLLIHNFSPAWIFALNGVFWSIAVEVQLYVLYPLLWKLRSRWGIAGALKFTLVLSIASRIIAAVFLTEWDKELSGTVWTFPTMLWFDWTLGAFLAERFLGGSRAFSPSRSLRWIVLALVVLSTFSKTTAIFAFSLASFFFALVCESYLRRERDVNWLERCLVPVGLCSYSLYLLHYPLIPMVARELRRFALFNTELGLLGAAPIAILILTALSFAAYATIEKGSIAIGRVLRTRLSSKEE